MFWCEQGVRIFRVDNPHTKAFRFWEWVIAEVRKDYPDAIFLAEAFTRPKVMYRLAKLGFTQSYTYFAWRNTKAELTQYFTELTRTEVAEYLPPQPVAEHAGYPDRVSAIRRPTGLHGAPGACRDARAPTTASMARRSSFAKMSRGSPAARSISIRKSTRSEHWDLDEARQPERVHRAGEPDSARQSGAAQRPQLAFSPRRQ